METLFIKHGMSTTTQLSDFVLCLAFQKYQKIMNWICFHPQCSKPDRNSERVQLILQNK